MTCELEENNPILACSQCFNDHGLILMAERVGRSDESLCPNCHINSGAKLDLNAVCELAHNYFVSGSHFNSTFGSANTVNINSYHFGKTDIIVPSWLEGDINLLEKLTQKGFFHYGPRLYRLGEIEPLLNLTRGNSIEQLEVINKIINNFSSITIPANTHFYRLRKNPRSGDAAIEYDSPPIEFSGAGRLDSKGFPVWYGSQDLEVCIHECRVTTEDDLYIGRLANTKTLKILDLTADIIEEGDPFTSLSLTVRMLFNAPSHAYITLRTIALAVHKTGYDGIIYPSYFNRVHKDKEKTIPNIALFGHPIQEDKLHLVCADRLILNTVNYEYNFGPASIK